MLERLSFRPDGVNAVNGANVPEHRPRARRRHGARPRHRPAAGRRRRDRDRRRPPGPAGAHGPAGDQELHPAGQEVRPRQPRPRAPRPLQRRGHLRREPGLRRGVPRPVERQPALLRPAGRQDRLAAGRSGRPPVDRAAAGGLPRRRHVQAVLRRQLPRDRACRARRPPAHHLRRPTARRRHRGHPLHAAGRRPRRTADQRRRRPADPAGHPQLPLPGPPQPGSAGPEGRAARRGVRTTGGGNIITGADRGRPPTDHHQRDHRPDEPAGPDRRPGGTAGSGTIRAGQAHDRRWPNRPSWSTCSCSAGSCWAGSRTTSAPRSWPRHWCATRRTTVRPGWPGPGRGPPSTASPRLSPTSTPRGGAGRTGPRWTRSGRRSSRRSGATPKLACCAGTRNDAVPTSPRWVRWPCWRPSRGGSRRRSACSARRDAATGGSPRSLSPSSTSGAA